MAAVEKLTDRAVLRRIADNDKEEWVRVAARATLERIGK